MGFYQRYEEVCLAHGVKPGSEKAAQAIGVKRSNISMWKRHGYTPKAETIAVIAETYGVSPDYLLGRTDDPVDYSNHDLIAELSPDVIEEMGGDIKKAFAVQAAIANDALREQGEINHFMRSVFQRLDDIDRAKVEAFAQGLLEQEKYNKSNLTIQDA